MRETKSHWEFSNSELEKHFGPHVIIADIKYWIDNRVQIIEWLDTCVESWRLEGVVITFNTKRDQTLFKLAWDQC